MAPDHSHPPVCAFGEIPKRPILTVDDNLLGIMVVYSKCGKQCSVQNENLNGKIKGILFGRPFYINLSNKSDNGNE